MSPSERLRQSRVLAGYKSVAKAALALGVPESSYRAHENGQNDFTASQAARYAEAFSVTAEYLLLGKEDREVAPIDDLVEILRRKGILTEAESEFILKRH